MTILWLSQGEITVHLYFNSGNPTFVVAAFCSETNFNVFLFKSKKWMLTCCLRKRDIFEKYKTGINEKKDPNLPRSTLFHSSDHVL